MPSTRPLTIAVIALIAGGCIARGPDDYRTVTRGLIDTRQAEIGNCFVGHRGKVVINFTVEKKTGKISNPVLDEQQSTAPAEVGACVVTTIDGLGIEQPDMRDGAATFTWQVSQ
jgi:hypothetical protein